MSTVARDIVSSGAESNAPALQQATGARTRILCVSDLGSTSERALQRASALARTDGADLMVLHVLGNDQAHAVLSSADRARLRVCVPSERTLPEHEQPTAIVIRAGQPLRVIESTAREWNAQLIVIAPPQRTALDRIVGTFEERLLGSLQLPVLVARGSTPVTYSNVVVAYDLAPSSLRAAGRSFELGFTRDAEITFIHSFSPPYEGIDLGDARAAEQLNTYRLKTARLADQQLMADMRQQELDLQRIRFKADMASESSAGILALLGGTNADLLIMSVRRNVGLKRILGRSTSYNILRNARCDVLAVPD